MKDINNAISIITGKLQSWLETLIAMLPNVLVAVLVIVVFYLIARLARKIADNLIRRVSHHSALNGLFIKLIFLSVMIFGLITALNILHLDKTVSSLLAGAGIIGLALGFAFQDISANFISGVILAIRRPIKVGDIIESGGYFGSVETVDLRETIIKTFQGLHVIIPNKDVLQNPITNYTKTHERRIDFTMGVSYGEDLERVKKITLDRINELDYVNKDKKPQLYYEEFGDSSINFTVQIWIDYPDQPGYLEARSNLVMAIKKVYDDNNITIPFPIRTLDFGAKGGKELAQTSLKIIQDSQE